MVNGKKVIGTDNIRGIRDLISSKEVGELVEIGDYKKTAEIIENYYEEFLEGKELILPKGIIEDYEIGNIKMKIKNILN